MKKNFVVKTRGLIIDEQEKNYIISADSLEDAKEYAENRFKTEYVIAGEDMHFAVEQRKTGFILVSIVGFLVSVFLIYRNWNYGHEILTMKPDLVTVLYALGFYSAYIVRFKGFNRTFQSKLDLIVCPLLVIIISAILKIILQTKHLKFFGIFDLAISPHLVLGMAMILSWLGLKMGSYICYLLLGIFAVSNLSAFSAAMGSVWGPVFILTSYISTGIYIASDPLLRMIVPEVLNSVNRGNVQLKNEFNHGKNQFVELKKDVSNKLLK